MLHFVTHWKYLTSEVIRSCSAFGSGRWIGSRTGPVKISELSPEPQRYKKHSANWNFADPVAPISTACRPTTGSHPPASTRQNDTRWGGDPRIHEVWGGSWRLLSKTMQEVPGREIALSNAQYRTTEHCMPRPPRTPVLLTPVQSTLWSTTTTTTALLNYLNRFLYFYVFFIN